MNSREVVTYAGSTSITGFDDRSTGPELVAAVEGASGLVIHDPLSFPWEAFETAPSCPVIVDLDACDDHDLRALVPVLSILTASDLLLGDQGRVEAVCEEVGLPPIWGTKANIDAHIAAHTFSKTVDAQVRTITDRLAADEELTTVVLAGEEIRSWRLGFLALIADIRDRGSAPADAELDGIWGVHRRPGEPLECAVLAFRTSAPLNATS